jgi:hypothetical protein
MDNEGTEVRRGSMEADKEEGGTAVSSDGEG